MFEDLENKLKNAEKIVFVTGAGISQESGIPTFRSSPPTKIVTAITQ